MRKGIILSGGTGSRMWPVTLSTSKQLLPVYDKPMVYYPLANLMNMGIKDIALISNPDKIALYKTLFKNIKKLGIKMTYIVQKKPTGIAEALIITKNFINKSDVCLVLGDNIFHGDNLNSVLLKANASKRSSILGVRVNNPEQYGVLKLNENKKIVDIVEKPKKFISNYAVPGIYFYNNEDLNFAKQLKPSARGELEITDLNKNLLKKNKLDTYFLDRGAAWLDAGTFETYLEACHFVGTLQKRQGINIGCIEEISYFNKWISKSNLKYYLRSFSKNSYYNYLRALITND